MRRRDASDATVAIAKNTTCNWRQELSDDHHQYYCKRESPGLFCQFVYIVINIPGIACAAPPNTTYESDIESLWDGEPVPIGQFAVYRCKSGGAHADNITNDLYHLECLEWGNYSVPIWPDCQRSNIIILSLF